MRASGTICFLAFCAVFVTASICVPGLAESLPAGSHTFSVANGHFTLDGKPFQVISGEMHYPRIPRAYWRDRLRKARAMGLNTITTYTFWNEHEPRPGFFDFSGNNDVAEFIREAQQEGLYVILRPGPYVCAEWELGGYPAWLLKDRSLVLRSTDAKFLEATEHYLARLSKELAPLQIGNGGPIILVQVENEYGSFGSDHAYMERVHQMLVSGGFTKSQLYTADGADEVPKGSLPELPAGINFGGNDDAQKAFATLKRYRPNGPFINSEFWDGWFDHWGSRHAHTDVQKEAANLDWMLRQGYSVSFYMFHGGTSFGWMNGANSNGKNYQPDVTSYDYDSPLDESGRPSRKFAIFRDVIAKATGVTPPPLPDTPEPIKVAKFELSETASLWSELPKPVESPQPLSMEELDQSYGYVLYRAQIAAPVEGDLVLDTLHDYAQIYLNGELAGTLDRRLDQNSLAIHVVKANTRLDILVENTGRVNFTAVIRGEQAGITRAVTLAGQPVTGWKMYSLPMNDPASLKYSSERCQGACFYRGSFDVAQTADTFLDTSSFGKGQVWLNGHALGRIWNIGPQKALYVPGPWLKQGRNEVVVFDLKGDGRATLQGLDHAWLGGSAAMAGK